MMRAPKFTAEASLGNSTHTYRGEVRYGGVFVQGGTPANLLLDQLGDVESLVEVDDALLEDDRVADEPDNIDDLLEGETVSDEELDDAGDALMDEELAAEVVT